MTIAKIYEVEGFRFEFTPKGNPFKGMLIARFPEFEPHSAEVNLPSLRSRNDYAAEAAEVCGMDQKRLKIALNALCTRRQEEVEAAAQAEQELAEEEPEESPEVGEDEIDALVGRSGVLRRFVSDAAMIHGVVREKAPLKLLVLNALGAQLAPLPNGKPMGANVALIAQWGRGKNHLCDAVATLLPEDFFLAFESASAMSLYYLAETNPRILSHRWIYLNEAEAMDQLVELLRPLISGGKAVHLTVNKDGGGRNTDNSWSQREIERRTGVAQSTISAQKSYLVKSVKLLVEDHDGKLGLAKDADPSWWRKEGVLDGLPKPKQVWAWWRAQHDPPDPGTPDRPGYPPQDPADQPGSGVNGDRGSSGHRSEAPGQPAEEPEHQADRRGDRGDPHDPGQENALDKRESSQEAAPTGVIGGFENREGVSREDTEPENHIRDTGDHEGESA